MKVLSIEQMTMLKQLGVDTSKASLHYVYLPTARSIFNETDELESEPTLFACNPDMLEGYPTFALQDVIELLPKIIHVDHIECYLVILQAVDGFFVQYSEKDCLEDDIIWFYNDNILDAAYEMLIWVIENNYLKTK